MGARSRAGARELGDRLRVHREAAGMSLRELAPRIGRSAPHVHRLETGDRGATSETEVVHYLAACGAEYKDVQQLVDFCRDAMDRRGYWLCPSGHWMTDSLRSLVFHETKANRVVNYEPEVIPGLLQTEPYIQALFLHKVQSETSRQVRVDDRLQRQRMLFRNRPAKFTFFMHERALRLEVGDYRVMAEQLLAMLFFADQWNIGIRVIPAAARDHAVFGGAFLYLGFERYQPLIYLDGPVTGVFIEDDDYVTGYRSHLRQIAEVALDAEQSRVLIAELADEYDRAEGAWHDGWRVAQKQL